MNGFAQSLAGGVRHALMSALAALIAYLPVHMLGGTQAFWGAITAIGVVQTEFHASANSARNQSIGGLVGGLLGLAMFLLFGDGLGTFLAAVFLSVTTCWLLRVPTGGRIASTSS